MNGRSTVTRQSGWVSLTGCWSRNVLGCRRNGYTWIKTQQLSGCTTLTSSVRHICRSRVKSAGDVRERCRAAYPQGPKRGRAIRRQRLHAAYFVRAWDPMHLIVLGHTPERRGFKPVSLYGLHFIIKLGGRPVTGP